MSDAIAIGIDAGGTKVAAMLVDVGEGGTVLGRQVVETPATDADASTRTMVALARQLMAGRDDVRAVGVGAAGLVGRDGTVRFAPNVAWREYPLARRVAADVGLPTLVDNDANVAAWGEFRFGAGRGSNDMLLVTVGTGIGGGIVSAGRLFRGAHGFAAEIGHVIVEPGGPVCGCGNEGCWEQVASGRAIGRLGREAGRDHPESLVVELAGGDPERITGPVVTEAATKGDPVAMHVLTEVGRRLGEGIAGLVNILDPDMVVVGGGVIDAGDLIMDPARRAYRDSVEAPEHRDEVPILPAALGNEAGAVGAAALALDEMIAGR
jgi:glucokinase